MSALLVPKTTYLLTGKTVLRVGFSYSEDSGDYVVDDTRTAEDLYQFLVLFLRERHPALASQEIFIAGESYAGVYVPMFAARVLKGNEDAEVCVFQLGNRIGTSA